MIDTVKKILYKNDYIVVCAYCFNYLTRNLVRLDPGIRIIFPNPDHTMHRRRIYTEKKANASLLYGQQNLFNSFPCYLFCTRMIWRKGWIEPGRYEKSSSCKILSRARNWINFVPQTAATIPLPSILYKSFYTLTPPPAATSYENCIMFVVCCHSKGLKNCINDKKDLSANYLNVSFLKFKSRFV